MEMLQNNNSGQLTAWAMDNGGVDGKNSVDFTKSVPQIPNFREDT